MPLPSWRTRVVLVSGLLLWACSSSTEVCACPSGQPLAVVYGTVQLSSGAPAAGAVVSAYIARTDGCVARTFPDGLVQTQADGRYSLPLVAAAVDTNRICVLVRTTGAPGSGVTGPVDTSVELAFRDTPPTDSAKVDVTLGAP